VERERERDETRRRQHEDRDRREDWRVQRSADATAHEHVVASSIPGGQEEVE
jgi:hypothetical protein